LILLNCIKFRPARALQICCWKFFSIFKNGVTGGLGTNSSSKAAIILHWEYKERHCKMPQGVRGQTQFGQNDQPVVPRDFPNKLMGLVRVRRGQNEQVSQVKSGSSATCRPRCHTELPEGLRNELTHFSESLVHPFNPQKVKGHHLIFQQDSTPAHKAKIVQTWLKNHTTDSITSQD
jgi:hypothetical protein